MKVKQVENMLDLIELFAREKSPRTLTALSKLLDMPKSSTFNLINTLVSRGFLYETRHRGGYYPTRRLLDISRDLMTGDVFLQRIHGELKALATNTGETVLLAVRDQDVVIYVDVVESPALIRYFAKVGERRPVYATSSGKAILTTYGEAERKTILRSLPYVAHEKTTMRNAGQMAADLELAMNRGWCEDNAEYTPDVMGIGVPLVHDERRFGLAVAGPMFRMQDRRTDLAALLRATASRIKTIIKE
jgi:IclR family acetate operon transcriptional repressor